MLGIWFNHDDYLVRKKQEDLACLKLLGFTDAFVLFKGVFADMRDKPDHHRYLDFLIQSIRQNGSRVHGVFFCSEDRKYTRLYPDRTDTAIFPKNETRRISHLDTAYIEYLTRSIITAGEEYSLDGIQLDFVRFGTIFNGWSPEEERIYRSFGVNVSLLKEEILGSYDLSKPRYNLNALFARYEENDGQLLAFEKARRSIIRNFVRALTANVRSGLSTTELSAAMMPEELYASRLFDAAIHYGQRYEDFSPCFDYLVPMIYAGVYHQDSKWVSELAANLSERYPGSVIGIESIEPKTGKELHAEIEAIQKIDHAGISFFRYGRMVFSARDGKDTLLYNTYPGTVTRLVLTCGEKEVVKDCELEEASWMRLSGHWDQIRAFGRFFTGETQAYEGELCVLDRGSL